MNHEHSGCWQTVHIYCHKNEYRLTGVKMHLHNQQVSTVASVGANSPHKGGHRGMAREQLNENTHVKDKDNTDFDRENTVCATSNGFSMKTREIEKVIKLDEYHCYDPNIQEKLLDDALRCFNLAVEHDIALERRVRSKMATPSDSSGIDCGTRILTSPHIFEQILNLLALFRPAECVQTFQDWQLNRWKVDDLKPISRSEINRVLPLTYVSLEGAKGSEKNIKSVIGTDEKKKGRSRNILDVAGIVLGEPAYHAYITALVKLDELGSEGRVDREVPSPFVSRSDVSKYNEIYGEFSFDKCNDKTFLGSHKYLKQAIQELAAVAPSFVDKRVCREPQTEINSEEVALQMKSKRPLANIANIHATSSSAAMIAVLVAGGGQLGGGDNTSPNQAPSFLTTNLSERNEAARMVGLSSLIPFTNHNTTGGTASAKFLFSAARSLYSRLPLRSSSILLTPSLFFDAPLARAGVSSSRTRDRSRRVDENNSSSLISLTGSFNALLIPESPQIQHSCRLFDSNAIVSMYSLQTPENGISRATHRYIIGAKCHYSNRSMGKVHLRTRTFYPVISHLCTLARCKASSHHIPPHSLSMVWSSNNLSKPLFHKGMQPFQQHQDNTESKVNCGNDCDEVSNDDNCLADSVHYIRCAVSMWEKMKTCNIDVTEDL